MNSKGFTLTELVIILVLLGILAVFAAPRLIDVTSTKAAAFSDKLRADIRYAQNSAMTASRRARVYFNGTGTAPGTGYAAAIDSSAGGDCSAFAPLADPALGGNLTVTVNSGSYAGITVAPGLTCLEYDSLGRPYNCGAGALVCSTTLLGAVMTIAVNANGTTVRTLTVAAQTGAVN